jgi:hypothetical protein
MTNNDDVNNLKKSSAKNFVLNLCVVPRGPDPKKHGIYNI